MAEEESEYKKAKAYSYRLLAMQAVTQGRLQERLHKRGVSHKTAHEVVKDLTQAGYLDDESYAAQLVAKEVARGYGPHAIVAKLISRGVPPSLARQAVETIYTEELERDTIAKLAALPRYSSLPRHKFLSFLYRRGFSVENVRATY